MKRRVLFQINQKSNAYGRKIVRYHNIHEVYEESIGNILVCIIIPDMKFIRVRLFRKDHRTCTIHNQSISERTINVCVRCNSSCVTSFFFMFLTLFEHFFEIFRTSLPVPYVPVQ